MINTKIFKLDHHLGLFWFRVFGQGLIIKNVRINPLLFSQRYNKRLCIKIGDYFIGVLPSEMKMSKA